MLDFDQHALFSYFCPCYKKELYILPDFLPTPTLIALFSIAVAPATSLPVNQACDTDIISYSWLLVKPCQILQIILHDVFKRPPFLSVCISLMLAQFPALLCLSYCTLAHDHQGWIHQMQHAWSHSCTLSWSLFSLIQLTFHLVSKYLCTLPYQSRMSVNL